VKQRWHFTNKASQHHADREPLPWHHHRDVLRRPSTSALSCGYGEAEVLVEIDSGRVHGAFPPRALRLVLEWRSLHLDELQEDWQRCQAQEPLNPIAPLE
jgi:hypothetical protein